MQPSQFYHQPVMTSDDLISHIYATVRSSGDKGFAPRPCAGGKTCVVAPHNRTSLLSGAIITRYLKTTSVWLKPRRGWPLVFTSLLGEERLIRQVTRTDERLFTAAKSVLLRRP